MRRRRLAAALGIAAVALGVALAGRATGPARPAAPRNAPESTFFATAWIEPNTSLKTESDGDLWASCWSGDGHLYAANGDGKGFGAMSWDIVVNRLAGEPEPANTLDGEALAAGGSVGSIWAGAPYNRKPTGMLCVDGAIYLAVQDLNRNFDDAPNASISKSVDGGVNWSWDMAAPMFSDHVFTTIFFLDYGRDGADNPDPEHVYAYGLDNNWRGSFSHSVSDPVDLYLARIPRSSIQDRGTWQYSTGPGTWSAPGAIAKRVPVLHDDRRIYPRLFSKHVAGLTRLGQGGVVYDRPLKRYIYSSWTEYTFELYEAPEPWGPWAHFLTQDFGGYPWTAAKAGGYATTIPSRFISADGRGMWLQSNVCPCGGGGTERYDFTLRRVRLEPHAPSQPVNVPDAAANLALPDTGAVPIARAIHQGTVPVAAGGHLRWPEDDWNDEPKAASWWGVTWPRSQRMSRLVLVTGPASATGGWFDEAPRVQVRRGFRWVDVAGQRLDPQYRGGAGDPTPRTFTFDFPPAEGDGVRVIGRPGGSGHYTSISELGVYLV